MKIKLKGFFKITTITSYLRVTSKIALFGSLKGKVISNSSFTLTKLCVARNLEKKKPFVPWTKMTKHIIQLYIYTATFYGLDIL